MKNHVLVSVIMASLMACFFPLLNAYCLPFSHIHSRSIHPSNIMVYFSYHSVGGGFIRVQVAQGSRVPVPEGSDPSSSCMHISVWPQALNGEYNTLLRHSTKWSGASPRMPHKKAHVCENGHHYICQYHMNIPISPFSPEWGAPITINSYCFGALQCRQGFSTTDSSWSVFQHRLQRTAPRITARPSPSSPPPSVSRLLIYNSI